MSRYGLPVQRFRVQRCTTAILSVSYTLDVSEQIEFCAQLYYNCKAAGQEPKLLNDEQISSVLEAFQTYRQK